MANALRSVSLSQIKSRLLNVSQTSLYELTLGIPEAVRRCLPFSGFDYDNINLMCAEAALPGSSLSTLPGSLAFFPKISWSGDHPPSRTSCPLAALMATTSSCHSSSGNIGLLGLM